MENPLLLNLANRLAALEEARAAAPHATPSFAGIDAVERATRDVVMAAHTLVARSSSTGNDRPAPTPVPQKEPACWPYLRVGEYTINKEQLVYVKTTADGTCVHFHGNETLSFTGGAARVLQAYLDMYAESIAWTVIQAEAQEVAR